MPLFPILTGNFLLNNFLISKIQILVLEAGGEEPVITDIISMSGNVIL